MDILVSREKLSSLFYIAERVSLHEAIIRNKFCERPFLVRLFSREDPRDRALLNDKFMRQHGNASPLDKWIFHGVGQPPTPAPFYLPEWRDYSGVIDMEAPCRKCDGCLRVKRLEWSTRCATEIRRSTRTWMATFTYTPQNHFFCKLRAGKKSHEWQVARDVAKFMKRLRTNFKQRIAYMYVLERHKSGLPHAHALIHERSLRGLRKRELQDTWSYGFSTFKLIELDQGASVQRASRYVVKYLQKEQEARVRASLKYGRPLT